jgi:hypothetical protein
MTMPDATTRTVLTLAVALLALTAGCSTLSDVAPGGSSTPTAEPSTETPEPTETATASPTESEAAAAPTPSATPSPTDAGAAGDPTPTATPTPAADPSGDISDPTDVPTVDRTLNTDTNLGTVGYFNETGRQIQRPMADDSGNASLADLLTVQAYTLRVDTTVASGGQTVVTNQTVLVDRAANRTYVRTERTVGTEDPRTLVTERYSNGTGVYIRRSIAGGGATYGYRSTAEVARNVLAVSNNSTAPGLDSRVDFDRSTTADGEPLLTADSAAQLYPTAAREDVQDVSVRLVVDDELDLVQSMRYHVELAAGGDTVVYDTRRRVTAVGRTTVTPPGWLPTAKNRTAG